MNDVYGERRHLLDDEFWNDTGHETCFCKSLEGAMEEHGAGTDVFDVEKIEVLGRLVVPCAGV